MNKLLLPVCIKHIKDAIKLNKSHNVEIDGLPVGLIVFAGMIIKVSHQIVDNTSLVLHLFDGTGEIKAICKKKNESIKRIIDSIQPCSTRVKITGFIQKKKVIAKKLIILEDNFDIFYHIKEIEYMMKKHDLTDLKENESQQETKTFKKLTFKLNETDDLREDVMNLFRAKTNKNENQKNLSTNEIFVLLTQKNCTKNASFTSIGKILNVLKNQGFLYNTTSDDQWSATVF